MKPQRKKTRTVRAFAIVHVNGNLEEQPCLRGPGKHLEIFAKVTHAKQGRKLYWDFRGVKVVPITLTYEEPRQ